MDGHLQKPVSLESLKAALAQWMVLPDGAADSRVSDAGRESSDHATTAPAVDLARLSEVLGTDDADTMIEILQLFVQHFPMLLTDIEATVESGDRQALRDAAHAAKSAATSAAATSLGSLLAELEETSEVAHWDQLRMLLTEVAAEFERAERFCQAKQRGA